MRTLDSIGWNECWHRFPSEPAEFAQQSLVQLLKQCGVRWPRLYAAFKVAKHCTNCRGGTQNHIQHIGCDLQFIRPQFVEQIFGQMAQGHHFRRIQKPRTTLDGVKASEDFVQQRQIVRRTLQIDELVVDT